MNPVWLNIADQAIAIGVPLIVTTLVGLVLNNLRNELLKIVPKAAAWLTAARVDQAEAAISKMVVAQATQIAAGQITVKEAVASSMATLGTAARAAMALQGTTDEMLTARVTGSVLPTLSAPIVAAVATEGQKP